MRDMGYVILGFEPADVSLLPNYIDYWGDTNVSNPAHVGYEEGLFGRLC